MVRLLAVHERGSSAIITSVLALLVALFAFMSTLPFSASAQAQEGNDFSREELQLLALSPQARAIAVKLQCPVCDGQAITESTAAIARQMRARVQELVDDGATEEEILDFFVDRYGPSVLREPRPEGIAWGVWLAPPIILLFGFIVVVIGLRSGRRAKSEQQPAKPSRHSLADDNDIVGREINRITGNMN